MRTSLLLLPLLLVGCDTSEPATPPRQPPTPTELRLVYLVSPTPEYGSLEADVIEYTGGNGSTGRLENVDLPWTVAIDIPNDERHLYDLTASRYDGGATGGLRARITVDGVVRSDGVAAGSPGGLRMNRTARATYLHVPPDDL